ncbi:YaiI/YqxD family protein [Vibrio scophthalmi]|uniref:YaiI/YqxD family protein n=1 Tax=Vibrio scophthalmi TaxID=45658 RepID=UPI0038730D7F
MKIWVDADACPVVIKEVLFRAAQRTGVEITFIANQYIRTPAAANITSLQVEAGFDVADNEIVKRTEAGDLIITSDIPLADEVITKGGYALSSRGELFTKDNIKSRLNIRDFMETMRSSGIQSGGPAPMSQADRQQFANQLDKWLVQWQRAQK